MNGAINKIAFVLFVVAASFGAAAAPPKVNVQMDYYEVAGGTAEEIRRDMNKKRRDFVPSDGGQYDAYTKWNVKWRFWWHQSGDSCAITRVETELDVQYILPKLRDNRRLSSAVKRKWKKYMGALVRHEKEHARTGLSAAADIENKIGDMSPRLTCMLLEKDANDLGDNILRKARIRDKKFDNDTNHGTEEGAKFP